MTRKVIQIDIDKARQLYESGLSLSGVSNIMGFSRQIIYARLLDAGVEMRNRIGARGKAHLKGEMKRMRAAGMSFQAIARKLGCNTRTVQYHCKKHPTPKKKKRSRRRICSCCGIREVPTNPVNGVTLTRLCYLCYTNPPHDLDGIYSTPRMGGSAQALY